MSDINDISMEASDRTTDELSFPIENSEDKNLSHSNSEEESEANVLHASETANEIQTEIVSDVLIEETLENKTKTSSKLPLARIKQIMKFDPDCSLISREAMLLVSKATELFIEFLGKEAVKHTLNNKKKTVSRKDVEAAIDCAPNLCFLDGALEWE